MATLTNNKIKDTYQGLIKTNDNSVVSGTNQYLTDGFGNLTPLSVGTNNIGIGTTSPSSYKLDVSGTGRFTSDLTVQGSITSNDSVEINNNSSDGGSLVLHSSGYNNWQLDNFYGSLRIFSGGSIRQTILQNGNVGIGTTNPLAKLEIANGPGGEQLKFTRGTGGVRIVQDADSDSLYFYNNAGSINYLTLRNNGNVGIGTTSPSYKLDVSGTGRFTSTVTATGFITSSDLRLKKNIQDYSFDKKINISLKTYEFISDGGRKRYGVIAQELEKTNPEFVITDEQGYKSVSYIDLLMAKIAELENRLKTLEN
jgi:hypothetical protein